MAELTIALLQLTACGDDRDANLAKGEAYCRRASAMGADVALFPEMWSTGYTHPFKQDESENLWREPSLWPAGATSPALAREVDLARWRALAIDRDSAFVRHFRALARELDVAIALTYLERWPGAPRNTVSLIDRHGELALTYAKVHTCDFDLPEAACTPGDDFPVCALDTAAGAVRVGAMICYDREFPESARILMLRGAEIILTPNACELEVNRLAQFRTRAIENMVGAAMANYAAPQENGHSVAYHPLAFDARGSRDTLVVEAGEGEGIYLARFDLDALRDWRRRETWGNAFRKPHRYGLLTALDVAPPFVRVDAAGEPYDRARR
ncbi:MAG TPA: carbon-nitrogen hydrolase family protein [Thermomicrobiales bacterium]|nr:carbon-nitrogen hydrolase family protein [Thermomicrobiales bacterium]